ncbi:MAG: response regulator [Deltaproteobacteria bacterium]|jgi:DNA-binding NtrC family response regulator|nr:MAG: response regulator [Deltaproteobacteria bacterium]
MRRILVVDDSLSVRESLRIIFKDKFDIITSGFDENPFSLANTEDIELVILGIVHPLDSRIGFLQRLIEYNQNIAVLLMMEYRTSEEVIDAFDHRNFDFVFKPFSIYEVREKVQRLLSRKESVSSLSEVTHKTRNIVKYRKIYESPLLEQQVSAILPKALDNDAPVLIKGEMGSGQEWVAKMIHYNGLRSEGEFFKLNCVNLSEESFVNTLLAIKKEASCKSPCTLFLEEIEEADLSIQMGLMEVIEEQRITAKGKKEFDLNLRVIASTGRDILEKINSGEFREDLFYRLNTIPISLSPLRERKEDIPSIADYILSDLSQSMKLQDKRLSAGALNLLKNYYWPGNIIELESVITRSAILADKEVISNRELSFGIDDNTISSPSEDEKPEACLHLSVCADTHRQEDNLKTSDISFEALITSLAHEVKNPLVSIKTFAQLLPERFEDAEFRGRFYQIVGENVEKINNLVEEITGYTKFSKPKFCPVDLQTVIGEVMEKHSYNLGESKSAILREFDKGLPPVLSDKDQLLYIFDNVFSNILTTAPGGKGLSITTGVSEFNHGEVNHLIRLEEMDNNKAVEIIIPLSHPVITSLSLSTYPPILDLELFLAQRLVNKNLGMMEIANFNEEGVTCQRAKHRQAIRIKLPVALTEGS